MDFKTILLVLVIEGLAVIAMAVNDAWHVREYNKLVSKGDIADVMSASDNTVKFMFGVFVNKKLLHEFMYLRARTLMLVNETKAESTGYILSNKIITKKWPELGSAVNVFYCRVLGAANESRRSDAHIINISFSYVLVKDIYEAETDATLTPEDRETAMHEAAFRLHKMNVLAVEDPLTVALREVIKNVVK